MIVLVGVTCLIMLIGGSALSQPGRVPTEKPYERLEQYKKIRLIEMLDMKEEQSVRFFSRLNDHEREKDDLLKRKAGLLDRIEKLVRNRTESVEMEAVFADVSALNAKVLAEDEKFFAGLKEILSPEQRGKFILFERQFDRELREAMKVIQRRRHRKE